MKSEAVIKAEVRYWDGVLAGLKNVKPDLDDKVDTIDKMAVVAGASVTRLNWVLADDKKGG
ncbi:hypothetical protein ES705_21012 [subsurface metagenome]